MYKTFLGIELGFTGIKAVLRKHGKNAYHGQ